MTRLLRLLRDDWRKNYRHHGGLGALARCWNGDRRLRRGAALPEPRPVPPLDCAVFSVVPLMSALWAAMFERVIRLRPLRILMGDCSGALRGGSEVCSTVPMLNAHHGEKLDLFVERLCRADVFLATDDDIFWLDEEPLVWALDELTRKPEVAVVALQPKRSLSKILRGKVERAMGSVLVIRREVWQREELSFRVVHPPPSEGFTWHYDTGEFAQVELGRRGYRVEFCPRELQRHFVFFEGVSSWTLKMQKHSGDLRAAVAGIPVRQEKALQTVFVLRGLADLVAELWHEDRPAHLLAPPVLDRAERICAELLGAERVGTIRREVGASLDQVRRKARQLDRDGSLGDSVRRMLGSGRGS